MTPVRTSLVPYLEPQSYHSLITAPNLILVSQTSHERFEEYSQDGDSEEYEAQSPGTDTHLSPYQRPVRESLGEAQL